ncbi:hypothetical protein, partial [Legionella spiritensis]|uniref:hypothetical protein n=1 Tax=Legionella spiritensis TaxID=452 RepID=UPI0007303236
AHQTRNTAAGLLTGYCFFAKNGAKKILVHRAWQTGSGRIAGFMFQYCPGETGEYPANVIPHYGFAFMKGYKKLLGDVPEVYLPDEAM